MVHEKYKYINGKRYGPYLYENRRIGDKVFTTYLGKHSEKSVGEKVYLPTGKSFIYFFFMLVILGLIGFVLYSGVSPTGKVSLDIGSSYKPGEILDGQLKLNLQEGELIPSSSKLILENNGKNFEFNLKDLVSDETVVGNFYVQEASISGSGEGYGISGEKEVFPIVYFTLSILSQDISPGESSGNDSIPIPITEESSNESPSLESESPPVIEETIEPTQIEETQETPNEGAPVTGNAILEFLGVFLISF